LTSPRARRVARVTIIQSQVCRVSSIDQAPHPPRSCDSGDPGSLQPVEWARVRCIASGTDTRPGLARPSPSASPKCSARLTDALERRGAPPSALVSMPVGLCQYLATGAGLGDLGEGGWRHGGGCRRVRGRRRHREQPGPPPQAAWLNAGVTSRACHVWCLERGWRLEWGPATAHGPGPGRGRGESGKGGKRNSSMLAFPLQVPQPERSVIAIPPAHRTRTMCG
jgi:hypothetical protein